MTESDQPISPGRRLQKKSKKIGDFKCVAAIDFGTDGTGIGIGFPGGNDIYPIKYGNNGKKKNKTCISIDADTNEFISYGEQSLSNFLKMQEQEMETPGGDSEYETKGNNARNDELVFMHFKMLLFDSINNNSDITDIKDDSESDNNGGNSNGLPMIIEATNGGKIETEILFREAFKYIKHETLQFLKKKCFNIEHGTDDIQWVLTVPAIWSPIAKYSMRNWATKAGLINDNIQDHLKIVYEPEAASIALQHELAKQNISNDDNKFNVGDKYIIIDAGGGTVDIACHRISEPFHMEEIHLPTGGPFGSTKIDIQYKKFLYKLFPKELHTLLDKCIHDIMEKFRKAKKTFDGKNEYHNVQLNSSFVIEGNDEMDDFMDLKYNDEHQKIQDEFYDDYNDNDFLAYYITEMKHNYHNKVRLPSDELILQIHNSIWKSEFFDPIIDPTINIVKGLLPKLDSNDDNKTKHLLLAGGLSTSAYFKSKITTIFGPGTQYNLAIHSSSSPVLLVVDGAVRMGLRFLEVKKYQEYLEFLANKPYIKQKSNNNVAGGGGGSGGDSNENNNDSDSNSDYPIIIPKEVKPQILQRKARYTFGLATQKLKSKLLRELKERPEIEIPQSFIDRNSRLRGQSGKKQIYVSNLLSIFYKKGDDIDVNACKTRQYERSDTSKKVDIQIYGSHDENAFYIHESDQPMYKKSIQFPDNYYDSKRFDIKFYFAGEETKLTVIFKNKNNTDFIEQKYTLKPLKN